jgi:hypothetical protein
VIGEIDIFANVDPGFTEDGSLGGIIADAMLFV